MSTAESSVAPAITASTPASAVTSAPKMSDAEKRSLRWRTKRLRERKACPTPDCANKMDRYSERCRTCHFARIRSDTTLTCSQCRTTFTRKACEVAKAKRRCRAVFCSAACRNARNRDWQGKKCEVCGNLTGKKTKRYCDSCRASHGWAARKRLPVAKNCTLCGRDFSPHSSRKQYCSPACANEAHSIRMRGAGNSHYKTGTSYAKLFREMRPLILERDGCRCVLCGRAERKYPARTRRGKPYLRSNLTVHHINEDVKNNTPENLVTICARCHQANHHSAFPPVQSEEFGRYALSASLSMTSPWKETVTSLQTAY